MKRTRSAASTPGVALFPFLAVLLCTMGALILLLGIIARQARLQAAELHEAQSTVVLATVDGGTDAERAELEWRIEQLRQARQKTLDRMADARLELSHLEDHARRLIDQLESMADSTLSLDDVAAARGRDRAQIEADLAAVRAQIDALRREIDQARERLAQREPAYAIIPYEGPSHTRRRPVYIECRDDAIVIQPEGIQLFVADFEGSLGPGNVLASALRAAQEYSLLVAPGESGSSAQPYPLLIVRPEGTIAYYVARAAMSSWNSEFGYELVESDIKLAYPPPDPKLAELMARAVDEARRRQAVLAAAAPRTVLDRGRPVYRAATSRGGAVLEGGDDRGFGLARGASRFQPEQSSFGGASSRGLGAVGERGGSSAYPTELKPAPEGAPNLSGAGPSPGGRGFGDAGGGAALGEPAHASGRSAQGNADNTATGAGSSASTAAGAATASSTPGSRYPITESHATGGYDGAQPNQSNGSFDASFGESTQPSGGRPRGDTATSGGSSSSAYRSSDASAGAGSSMPAQGAPGSQPGAGSFSLNAPMGAGAKQSLAARRGRDWGLPDAARGAIPITRPVQIDCYSDHLTVYASGPSSPNKVIPLEGATEASVDSLVSAVWEQIATWGIAGNRMYWKPVLSFHVVDNGDARFQDLEQLLDGSGMEVRRTGGSPR